MTWFYLPLAITAATAAFYAFLEASQDRSGAGMIGFFLAFPLSIVNLLAWLIYFACGMYLGIR